MTAVKGPGLYEFLIESELQQYYAGIKNDLKIQNVAQLKYVAEEDLHQIGMSKPEMRRLKKFFQKHYPQNYIHKFKKLLLTRRDDHPSVELVLPDDSRDRPSVKIPNKHMIPVESIIVNKELGQGEFGVVQQGVWTNDGDRIQVAIKCLSRERMQNNPIEFLKEAAIMHAIDHEHIVRLYGCVLDTNALMLVTELAPLRSLLECLKEPSLRASFPVLSLCDFAIQICDGMQYLEMKRLIHRDLAARNILVFSKHKVKISDFGLSRALGVGKDYYQTNFNVNLKLPIAWCAPECISYLRFTSASDMWAYGVTLWEMFSYGFQPWAALTGHQILEAIDQPNFQRLEQPECCPKEYFSVMLKCWQHDPNKRPRFLDLATTLPECKPEQVQAVQELSGEGKPRDQLLYRVGDIITVLDKGNVMGCWKGVLNNGKTGLFNPAHTVSYLGSDLPSSKPGEFIRGDGKNAYSSRRRLRTDMISSPQGDVKHTGHVGLDGAYFGDIAFLGGKAHSLPQQVVAPYKPHEDSSEGGDHHSAVSRTCSDMSDRAPLISAQHNVKQQQTQPVVAAAAKALLADHEYHEISDEEALESPRSETSFDFGPSLLDEMDAVFRSLGGSPPPSPGQPPPPDETVNVRNELRELASKVSGKKKQATVKPISASDSRTLDSAIAMATELAARSMNDLDGGTSPPESPRTPTTPGKRKFSFRFPPTAGHNNNNGKTEKRSFSDEAASIPDMQSTISDAAREVYSSLVEQPQSASPAAETNPLRLLRSKGFPAVRPRVRGNKHNNLLEPVGGGGGRQLPKLRVPPPPSSAPPPVPRADAEGCGFPYGQADAMSTFEVKSINPNARKLSVRSSSTEDGGCETDEDNPIPLPPRDRTRPLPPTKPRHQRKHPLIIPATSALAKMADAVAVDQSEQPAEDSLQDKVLAKCLDDSFEQQIACELAALDDMPCGEDDTTLTEDHASSRVDSSDHAAAMTRQSDHVSCEDLLEFACDAPNAKRTRGKARGVSSDEVRIMGKVLGPEVSVEECMMALNASDWDVHRAIKLTRLHTLLHGGQGLAVCNQALEATAWDVARAASWVLAYQDQGDTTQV